MILQKLVLDKDGNAVFNADGTPQLVDRSQAESDALFDDVVPVPRKWLKALLQALVAKGIFTAQEVQMFLNNNRA